MRGKVSDQFGRPEFPARDGVRLPDRIGKRAEFRRMHDHRIADMMGKTAAGAIPVLVRRKHGACEEDDAVRVLMICAERLAHQVWTSRLISVIELPSSSRKLSSPSTVSDT